MTREKLKEVIKKAYEAEMVGHSFRDPTADHIGNLADRILAALESERVWEVVMPEDQLIAMCTGGTVEREFWNKIKGKKGSLIFRPEVER